MRENNKYREVRDRVKKRDNYTCQMCYKRKRKCHVHHILPYSSNPSVRYNPFNLIVLCKTCHWSIWKKEHLFAKDLMRKARENELDSS